MPTTPVKLIDISHHQGRPNFSQVAQYGVLGMIHKATEGSGYVDPDRARNCSEALKNGIAVCTYHFLRPGNMAQQMEFWADVVDPVPGERMVLDHEDAGVSIDDLHDCIKALQDMDLNIQITVYSGHVLKEQLGSYHDEFLANNTDLWVAHYGTSSPSWPSGTYETYSAWQYSDTGTIPGISDNYVDLNEFNGSDTNLVKWIGPVDYAPPEEVPGFPESVVEMQITGPVTLIVNGQEIISQRTSSAQLRSRAKR